MFSQLSAASSRTSSIQSRLSALQGPDPGPAGPLDGRWQAVSATIKGKTVIVSAQVEFRAGVIDGPCARGIVTTGSSSLTAVWGADDSACDFQQAQAQRIIATVLLNNVTYRQTSSTLTIRNSFGYELIWRVVDGS